MYLDGKIINKGTVIVEKNVVISSSDSNRCGSITCEDGGLLLVMEGAQVMLGNGLTLQRNGQVINRGLITVREVFSINDSQIQIAAGGRLAIGFVYSNPDVLYVSDYKGTYDDFNKYVFRPSRPYYYVLPSDNYTVTGASKIIVEKGGALDLCYTINPYSFNKSSLVIGMDNGVENGLYGVETRSPYAQQQAHSYTGRLGTYYEFSYEACY